jgi:hypothetical protein
VTTTALQLLRPDAFAAFETAVQQSYAASPGDLLELCRARVHMLLGGGTSETDDAKLRAVGDYANSELFSELERLALEFTEQYVLDVAAMPDELVAALRDRLGTEALYAVVMGLYAVDQVERLASSAAVHPGTSR